MSKVLSSAEVATLNEARMILDRLSRLHWERGATADSGLVAATAEHAGHLVFQTLNYADTYLALGLSAAEMHPPRPEPVT